MGTRVRPLEVRFWAKVDRAGGPEACWPWVGALNRDGYGHFRLYGKAGPVVRANRLAVVLGDQVYGLVPPRDIPDGLFALHTCDNRACCNPSHLKIGDQSENMNDMWSRQRRPRPPKALSKSQLQRRTA